MTSVSIQYRDGKYKKTGKFSATFKVEFSDIIYLVAAASNSKEGLIAVRDYIIGEDFDPINFLGNDGHEFVAIYTASNSEKLFSVSSTNFSFTASSQHDVDSFFDVTPLKNDLSEISGEFNFGFRRAGDLLLELDYVCSIFNDEN